jgi:hypothetical protein
MKIDIHLTRAAAFERAVSKLDPLEDGELYAVYLMRAGTSRVNAAMHHLGLTLEGPAQPDRIGDLNHTYKPKLPGPPPDGLAAAFRSLAYIENLRPDYVRGAQPMTQEVARVAAESYAIITRDTEKILNGARP